MSLRKSLLPLLLAASLLHAAEIPDAPPPDAAAILEQLKVIKEQQLSQQKTLRDKALRAAMAAAASPSAAANAWEEAIRDTQFEGQPKEGAAFRAWKEKDGDALHDKEVQSAAHLYFRWLALTLQHSAGKTAKELLPDVYAYTRDLMADQIAMENFNENMKREEELYRTGKHGTRPVKPHTDQQTRQLHDSFLRGLNGSAPVKALMIDSLIESAAPAPKKNAKGGNAENAKGGGAEESKADWTSNPGDFDGIYATIILPELRAMRDTRVLEYWDLRIKRAGDAAARTKLAYDAEKFTNEIRPALLWSRAQELANIGQRNRSIAEMFSVLRNFPKHPAAASWISEIESLLAPGVTRPAAPSTSTSSPPAPEEPLPGAGLSQPPAVAPLPGAR